MRKLKHILGEGIPVCQRLLCRLLFSSRIARSSLLFLAGMFVPFAVEASSYATAYDIDIFLNQSHPFDSAIIQSPPLTESTPDALSGDFGSRDGEMNANERFNENNVFSGDHDGDSIGDPLEPMNRFIFGFNSFVNDFFLSPLARGYNNVVPDIARRSISSFLENLSSPVVLANDLMQFEIGRAYKTFERMLVNSTIGIFGLWDAAGWIGLEPHKEDFGQTLGVYGVGEGIYLVLPILGPSNPRDAIGRFGVDSFLDPVGLWLSKEGHDEWMWARTGAGALTGYAKIVDELTILEETSLDYYSAVRNFYRQKRKADILNQDSFDTGVSFDNIDYELDLDDL